MSAHGLGGTYGYSYGAGLRYDLLTPVTDHSVRIQETYRTQGAAAAVSQLVQAERDPQLSDDQRAQLIVELRPTIEAIAQDLGRNSRRTDLPASGASANTPGIDDQQEYKVTLADLAAALQSGNAEDIRRTAKILLQSTPAVPQATAGTDQLGLLGAGLRESGAAGAGLRAEVVALLRQPQHQNPAPGSELSLPLNRRIAVATTLEAMPVDSAQVPQGMDAASVRAYTDWAVIQARQSEKLADELYAPFKNGKKPEDDRAGWEAYVGRRTVANMDSARAAEAIAAELRTFYQGNPANRQLTEDAAHAIVMRSPADRTANDPLSQAAVAAALNLVLTESSQARNTNTKLYAVHRADDALNMLVLDRQAGKPVSDQQIAAARNAFAMARKELLQAVGAELDFEISGLSFMQREKEDGRVVAANRIGARYMEDAELQAALDAEVILRKTLDSYGPEQRMKTLGELTPRTLDPTTRALIMSDARGLEVTQEYIEWASEQVTQAYDSAAKYYDGYKHWTDYESRVFRGTPPALAATQKLLELTDPSARAYVKPEMVAQIFARLRMPNGASTSTMDRIIADVSLEGEWYRVLLDKDNPIGGAALTDYPTYNKVISNLSFAMDNMGRAQDAATGKYYSPQIEAEITWLGKRFAEATVGLPAPAGLGVSSAPYASRFDLAFRAAASQGSVILALETARQLAAPDAHITEGVYQGWKGTDQAAVTLKYVQEGIVAFDKNSKELLKQVNKNMAPISSPLARFGMNLTEDETRAAVVAILGTDKGEKVYEQMMKDRESLDLRGYQMMRLGETVGLYQHHIGGLERYGNVVAARNTLLNSQEGSVIVLASNTATLASGAKIAMKMIDSDYSQGQLLPQKYGWIAQGADFAEYWSETYLLQRRSADAKPGSKEYGRWGDPGKRAPQPAPGDVAGTQRLFNPGEGRINQTANGWGGTYVRNLTSASIEESNYRATRLGRTPLAGVGVWGGGGLAGAAMWDYLHNEAGFAQNEQWRKPILEGLVGGFAAFHLAEAGVATVRLTAPQWQAAQKSGALDWLRKSAPMIYQPTDAILGNTEWTRFIVDGTKGLTGTLAALMGLALVWDVSGVWYRGHDSSDPTQGFWGNKWWKVGTHAVNAVSDVILLRLQLREFAQRLTPGLIEDAMVPALVEGAGKKISASRFLSWIASRGHLSANPIGFWVNVAYLATAGTNWVIDQKRYIANLEFFDDAFLRGAGVAQPQAQLLKQHAFWTGDGKGDGFAIGYQALGGDPAKFVGYINSLDLDKLEAAIQAAGSLPDHVVAANAPPQLPRAVDSYLSLPTHIDAKIAADNPRFSFNVRTQRFEDSYTQMYFDGGHWIYYGARDAGPGADQLGSYDPQTHRVTLTDGRQVEIGGGPLKQEDANSAWLALPDDPAAVDLSKFPTIHWNSGKQRHEDSATGMYYDIEMKAWRVEDDLGDMGTYYYPREQKSVYYWTTGHKVTSRAPTGVDGWRAYLQAHEIALPPLAPPA